MNSKMNVLPKVSGADEREMNRNEYFANISRALR